MKKVIIISLSALLMASCAEIKQIGSAQVISTKSFKSIEGETLSTPSFKNKEIRKKAQKTIDKAIDVELANNPGATHMVNVKIYSIDKLFGTKFSVIGEVVKSK
jgi:hypothetical protein